MNTPTDVPTRTATPTWSLVGARVLYVSAGGDGVYIRSQPDMAARVRVWPDGTQMTVLGKEGDWCYVRAPDGYAGFVPAEYLTDSLPTNTPTAVPPTNTPVLPTAVPWVPPTNTPTAVPPTNTPRPPTAVPPTATPQPPPTKAPTAAPTKTRVGG
jgi:hypothetical protein